MFKKVKLLAQLKLNQTKIKHLCVSDEDYINKLIEKPYEALLQANVDIGDTSVYINVLPLISYTQQGIPLTSVDGLKVCFFIGKYACPQLGEQFNKPIYLGSWHSGIFSTAVNVPHEDEGLNKLVSLSFEIKGYGFEKGKLLNQEFFDQRWEQQRVEYKKKEAKEIASGHRFLKSNNFYNALQDFFYVHKPYKIDRQGSYIFDYEKIGLENFNIKIKSQIIYIRNNLVEQYDEDGNYRSIASAIDFRVPLRQFNDLFLVDGSYVTEIFSDANTSSSFQDEGVSKKDFVNFLKEFWIHQHQKEFGTELVVQSHFEFTFNNSVVPVYEHHKAIFKINEDETGLVYEKWIKSTQHASPELERNPELFLSEEDTSEVKNFIGKFMVKTQSDDDTLDDEIPF